MVEKINDIDGPFDPDETERLRRAYEGSCIEVMEHGVPDEIREYFEPVDGLQLEVGHVLTPKPGVFLTGEWSRTISGSAESSEDVQTVTKFAFATPQGERCYLVEAVPGDVFSMELVGRSRKWIERTEDMVDTPPRRVKMFRCQVLPDITYAT